MRFLEELFPFVFFLWHARRISKKASNSQIGAVGGKYHRYHALTSKILSERLNEEHKRAIAIDEKTVKLTFSISVALTILGATGGYLSKALQSGVLKLLVSGTAGLAIFYTLAGGLLALGALKTLPTYGFGTDYFLQKRNRKVSEVSALAAQETVNIVRHLRNESAYQCLRNGFFVLIVSTMIFVVALSIVPKNDKGSAGTNSPADESNE
jgi:hypothetical protein